MDKPQFKFIGKHRRAVEHKRFVTGQGRFAADIQLPQMLHTACIASPYAHAKIISIDASAALAVHGVVAVLNTSTNRSRCTTYMSNQRSSS